MNTLMKTGKYTLATIEYTGLVSLSYIKRSGSSIKGGFIKTATPIKNAIKSPFMRMKKQSETNSRIKDNILRLETIEKKLDQLNERLVSIEKRGFVTLKEQSVLANQKKTLTEDKRLLLKSILEANKALRS
ncbi:MAG: hypothetical protein HQK77_08045 [Desulfobacterales bacterium]|nr:hypothetical protein [Desulfobacterales bacterium]